MNRIVLERIIFSCAVFLCCSISHVSGTQGNLTLAVFVSAINMTSSFTGSSDIGRPFLEAVDLAVELINNDTALIPGYTLEYEITDAQVSFYTIAG